MLGSVGVTHSRFLFKNDATLNVVIKFEEGNWKRQQVRFSVVAFISFLQLIQCTACQRHHWGGKGFNFDILTWYILRFLFYIVGRAAQSV